MGNSMGDIPQERTRNTGPWCQSEIAAYDLIIVQEGDASQYLIVAEGDEWNIT